MWKRITDWIIRIPISDPVDRRNAFFLQLLLLYSGCKIPLHAVYLLLFNSAYIQLSEQSSDFPKLAVGIDLGTNLLMASSAWLGFFLIRKGHFRKAVSQYLGSMIISSLILYVNFGYRMWTGDLSAIEALTLSSLMLGRKALWIIYPAFMINYAAGMTMDYFFNPAVLHSMEAYSWLLPTMLSYFILVLILDRSSNALRMSLAEANLHRQQLQLEMAERARAQEQLLHAQKMDAVGKLASGIAHDFNNVLGIILGFALERHRLDEPGARRNADTAALSIALEGVEMAARRGASVSRKLLNFSRQEVTHTETFDAAATLRELQPLLQQLLPPQIRLRIKTPETPLPISFDRSQFELALLNIASNARDAMESGGDLALSASLEHPSTVCIIASDNGKGMPEEVKRRMFEPFYTTKPAGSGTGLGLTVVYGLVDRGGGSIEVDSTPGKGTTLRIRLPLANDAPMSLVPAQSALMQIHVLLVDDDDDLRGLLSSALRDSGCVVSAVSTGAEAEHLVGVSSIKPHVLVCDNRLTDTDGITLLPKLRRHLPDVPIILISAYLDTDGQPPNMAERFTERLPKPFSPDDLVARVRSAAHRHMLPQRMPDQPTTNT